MFVGLMHGHNTTTGVMHKYAVAPFVSGVRYGSAAVYLCLQLLCVNLRTHKHDRFLSTCLQNAGLLYKPLRVSMCACEFGCVPPFPVCVCVCGHSLGLPV